MSLINQALKRAQEAQQQAPPPAAPALHLRPVEPAHPARQTLGVMLPVALAAVALLLLLFLIWQTVQRNVSGFGVQSPTVAAVSQLGNSPSTASGPAATISAPPSTTAAVSQPVAVLVVSEPAPSTADANTDEPTANISAAVTEPAARPPPPKAPPSRLQAIVFNPSRPSAMINGKTLFLGDKLGEFRLAAIDAESATLIGAGQTNVLTLDQ